MGSVVGQLLSSCKSLGRILRKDGNLCYRWAVVLRAASVALCALALLASCHARTDEATRPIEVLVSTEVETLDPRVSTDAVSVRISRLVHAGLFRLDGETLEPVPYVAKSFAWEDALTLRVELRDDVRFNDGALVTPADVVATLAAFASKTSRHRRVVEAIASTEEAGPRSVRIRLREAHGTLLSDLELPVLRKVDAERESGITSLDALDGLGPFRVKHASRGEVLLEPRANGALPEPRHAVVIRTVRDENARALRMRGGQADVAVNAFSPTLLPAMGGLAEITERPAANLTYMLVRWDGRVDERLRHVLSLTLDRQRITSTLLGGRAVPARSLLPPMHWAFAENDTGGAYDFAPERARALLAEGGYRTDGTDGRLHFTLLTSTDRLRTSIARVLSQDLRAYGIDLDVTPLELGAMIARLSSGDFELAILQMPELTEPNALKTFLHGSLPPPLGVNRGRAHDPALDQALDEGERLYDKSDRKRAYSRAEVRASQVLPIIPLWHENHVTVVSPRAHGFRPSAEGRWLGLAALP